jgi:hypothetical protein
LFSYAVYGLGIRSELELPELQGADIEKDITICLGHVSRDLPPDWESNVWPVLNSHEAIMNLGKAGIIGI